MELPKHLGGHCNVTHIDGSSFKYIKDKYNAKSMLDIGCGPGGMVKYANDNGVKAVGIDGDFSIHRDLDIEVIIHDYTIEPFVPTSTYDMGWCVEFLEHVHEQYIPNFFATFKACKVILCTASNNPKGYHHVNCQLPEYWIKKFQEAGFKYMKEDTDYVRKNSSMKREFVRNTGMVFTYDHELVPA